MSDKFSGHASGLTAPARNGFAITPDDEQDLPGITRALYVGGAGAIVAQMQHGGVVTFENAPAGTILPIRIRRVLAATTATALIGLA